jgi:hypothetical protein
MALVYLIRDIHCGGCARLRLKSSELQCGTNAIVLVRQLGANLEELRYRRVSVLAVGGSDLATSSTVPRSPCTWLSISLCNTPAQPRRHARTSSSQKEKNLWRCAPNSSFSTPVSVRRSRYTTSCTPKILLHAPILHPHIARCTAYIFSHVYIIPAFGTLTQPSVCRVRSPSNVSPLHLFCEPTTVRSTSNLRHCPPLCELEQPNIGFGLLGRCCKMHLTVKIQPCRVGQRPLCVLLRIQHRYALPALGCYTRRCFHVWSNVQCQPCWGPKPQPYPKDGEQNPLQASKAWPPKRQRRVVFALQICGPYRIQFAHLLFGPSSCKGAYTGVKSKLYQFRMNFQKQMLHRHGTTCRETHAFREKAFRW